MAVAGPPGRQYWGASTSTSSANHRFSVPPTGSVHRDASCCGQCTRWLVQNFQTGTALRRHFLRAVAAAVLFVHRCGDFGFVSRHKPAEHHFPMFLQLQTLRRHVSRPVAAGVPRRCGVSNASCCGSGCLHLSRRCGVLVASCCGSGFSSCSTLRRPSGHYPLPRRCGDVFVMSLVHHFLWFFFHVCTQKPIVTSTPSWQRHVWWHRKLRKNRRRDMQQYCKALGGGSTAKRQKVETLSPFWAWYPLAIWDFGSLHQKLLVGVIFCGSTCWGYGYGIDVSIVYLISVRLSSSHLSNGSIRVLGGSTTMSSHWKQVHTDFRSTEDRCCRTGSNMSFSVHRVRISVASRNEFHRSSKVLKTMEVPQRSRWKLTGVSEMRLATLLLLLSRPSPRLFVSSSFIGRQISLRAGAWATIFLSVWQRRHVQPAPRTRLCFVSQLAYVFAPTSSVLLGRWVLSYCGIQVEFAAVLFWCSGLVALAFTGTRSPRVHGYRPLEVCKRPWSLRGSRGYAPHGFMGPMAGYAACCAPYTRRCPLVPVQSQSTELPATTVGESSRGGSLRRHKAGPLTVLLLCRVSFKPGGASPRKKSSCESRDSCFRIREKYSRVKAGTLWLNEGEDP